MVCALLLALTFSYLARLFPWVYLRHWSWAWWSLLLAVSSFWLSISLEPEAAHGLWAIYLAAQWAFLFFLLAGYRELTTNYRIRLRRFLPALPGSLLLAAAVVPFFDSYDPHTFPELGYSSLADLFGQLLLGFGMVFVISEEARRELTEALAEVQRAHDQIERQARLDPLTETLNRHAFHSILKGEGMDPTVRRGH